MTPIRALPVLLVIDIARRRVIEAPFARVGAAGSGGVAFPDRIEVEQILAPTV